MKKIYLLLTVTFLLCLTYITTIAQPPYKASVGGMLPSFFALVPSSNFFLENTLLFRQIF